MSNAATNPSATKKRLDFLDVARGGAALLILLEHGLHECVPGYYRFSQTNIVIGQAAILVFFMISGFVIPMSLEEGGSNAKFWLRRAFRLFPIYWLSIALAFAYLCFGGQLSVQISDTKTWLANLTLLQAWLNRPNVWGVFWSLHFEVAFYIVCSILSACRLLPRIGARTYGALLIAFGLGCIARLLRTKNPTDDMYNYLIVHSALFGLLAYRYATGKVTRRVFYGLISGLAGVLFLVWCVNHLLYPSVATPGQLMRSVIISVVGFGAFIWLLETRGRPLPALACWLGRRSYPIYLLHPLVLILLSPTHLPAWAFMPCLIGATLLVVEVAHRFVERPGIALGRLLERRPMSQATVAAEPVVVRQAA